MYVLILLALILTTFALLDTTESMKDYRAPLQERTMEVIPPVRSW